MVIDTVLDTKLGMDLHEVLGKFYCKCMEDSDFDSESMLRPTFHDKGELTTSEQVAQL